MSQRAKTIIIVLAVIAFCGLFVVGLLAGAAVVGYKAAMRAGYEVATLQNLKTIAAVETRYFISHDRKYASLEQLINEGLLSSKFAGHPAIADGYVFELSLTQDGSAAAYQLTANPRDESTGRNHFYLDSDDSRIRVNPDRPAGRTDPFN